MLSTVVLRKSDVTDCRYQLVTFREKSFHIEAYRGLFFTDFIKSFRYIVTTYKHMDVRGTT